MTKPLNIVFLGNHTLGVRTMAVIRQHAMLAGVVAHPDDPEDGVRYESVFAEAKRLGVPAVRMSGRRPELADFVRECAPDLLWIADYRYLIPAAVIALAPRGAVNLHPSLLPAYRGRAPVNWGILRGETVFGLTAHFVDEGMDTGDIIVQRSYALSPQEDIGDALEKLYPLYAAVTAEVLGPFNAGSVPRRAQESAGASAFPRRTPEDGRIDWTRPAREVWNLIRAVAAPYPGAFTAAGEGRLFAWKVAGVRAFAPGVAPRAGEILEIRDEGTSLRVACADAALEISRFTCDGIAKSELKVGGQLGSASILEEVAS